MKLLLILLSYFFLSEKTYNCEVVINNLNGKSGNLYIGWYDGPECFRDVDKTVFNRLKPVRGKETINVTFNDIPEETYAIAVFLDENKEGKLNINIFGAPSEPYGFSQNPNPRMRAARFEESAFELKSNKKLVIELRF